MSNTKKTFRIFNKEDKSNDKKLYKTFNNKNKIDNPLNAFKKLLHLYKDYRLKFIFSLFLIFLGFASSLIATLKLKSVVDSLINGEYTGFSNSLLLFGLFMFSGGILNYIGTASKAVVAQEITYSLRKKVFHHLENLNISFFDRNQSGDIISTFINDIDLISTALDQAVPEIFIASSQVIVALIILFILHPILASIITISTLVYICITMFFVKRANLYSVVMTNRLAEMNSFLEETLSSTSTIKAYNFESEAYRLFEEKSNKLRGTESRAFYFSRSIDSITNSFTLLLSAVIIMIGSVMVINESITLGLLVTYEQLIQQITSPIMLLAQQSQTLILSFAGIERVNSILSEEPEIDDGYVFLENIDDSLYWNKHNKLIPALRSYRI